MFPLSRSQEESVSMIAKVYIVLDEYEEFGVFGFVAKYVIISEGLWRERAREMMGYCQLKSVN